LTTTPSTIEYLRQNKEDDDITKGIKKEDENIVDDESKRLHTESGLREFVEREREIKKSRTVKESDIERRRIC